MWHDISLLNHEDFVDWQGSLAPPGEFSCSTDTTDRGVLGASRLRIRHRTPAAPAHASTVLRFVHPRDTKPHLRVRGVRATSARRSDALGICAVRRLARNHRRRSTAATTAALPRSHHRVHSPADPVGFQRRIAMSNPSAASPSSELPRRLKEDARTLLPFDASRSARTVSTGCTRTAKHAWWRRGSRRYGIAGGNRSAGSSS